LGSRRGWDRELRVFVSSTFSDLAHVREVLTKRVFPRVRAYCENLGVAFAEVDLRWGVPEEAIDQGRLIEHCFTEIDRCNCFLGILGSRYGSIVDVPPGAVRLYPWLAEHTGLSMTELEFHAGALRPDRGPDEHLFYFLDRTGGPAEDPRLTRLKRSVQERQFPVREGFENLDHLQEAIYDDLCALVDSLVQDEPAGESDSASAAHVRHAYRMTAGGFHGRQRILAELDSYLRDGGPPLLLTGPPGMGKTALLAAWRRRLDSDGGRHLPVFHFVDVPGDQASLKWVLAQLIEAGRAVGLVEGDVPKERLELPQAVPDWILGIAQRTPLLLVVDGVDALEDRHGARDLLWLPGELPDNVRVVVSAGSGRTWQAAVNRGFRVVNVDELGEAERLAYARDYLARFGKKLSGADGEMIGASEACGTPAFLEAVLGQLRIFSDYRGVAGELGWYVAAGSLEALYGRILARLQEDDQLGPPGRVAEVLALILGSRRGLLEAELLDLLGREGEPLEAAHWIPLRQRLASLIASERGLLRPVSELARQMTDRNLELSRTRRDIHRRLSDYFASRLESPRGQEEAPWQARRGQQWERLGDLWTDQRVLAYAEQTESLDDARLDWVDIERHTGRSIESAYAQVIDAPWASPEYAGRVADLLTSLGRLPEALELLVWLHRSAKYARNDLVAQANAAVRLSWAQASMGRLVPAVLTCADAVAAAKLAGDTALEARCTAEAARLFAAAGAVEEAIEKYEEALSLFRRLGLHFEVGSCLSNIGVLREESSDLTVALDLYRQAEQAFAKAGSSRWLARARSHQATARWLTHDTAGAIKLWNEVGATFRLIGDMQGLAMALANCGGSLAIGGSDPAVALPVLDEADELFRQDADVAGRARVQFSRVLVGIRKGRISRTEVLRLMELGKTNGQEALIKQLEMLRAFTPANNTTVLDVLDAVSSDLRAGSAFPPEAGRSLPEQNAVDSTDPRKEEAMSEDPFHGIPTIRLIGQIAEHTGKAGEADAAKNYDDAINHADAAMALFEAIEAHRPTAMNEEIFPFRLNAFTTHFNLALLLFKASRAERSLLEAVGAAGRYATWLSGADADSAETRSSTQSYAETLANIFDHLMGMVPESSELEAYRARAAGLKILAGAQPLVFAGWHGRALRALSVVAHEHGMANEAMSAGLESVRVLRKLVTVQGNAYIRELGFSMRHAIEALGREDLRAEYDEVVKREVEYVMQRARPE